MIRFRPGAVLAAVLLCALAGGTGTAFAAAEVHRLNLVLSGIPTQLGAGDFNDEIDRYNRTKLDSRGYDHIGKLQFAWAFEAQLRYFVRPNISVNAGVMQLRAEQRKQFSPALQQDVIVHAEILTVPVLVGAAYYLQPYNQGDFQARAFFGGGMTSQVYTRAQFDQIEVNTDSTTTFGPTLFAGTVYPANFRYSVSNDAPGYYLEGGVHMFFAARFSVMITALYRSARTDLVYFQGAPGGRVLTSDGNTFTIDTGGIGARIGLGIGF